MQSNRFVQLKMKLFAHQLLEILLSMIISQLTNMTTSNSITHAEYNHFSTYCPISGAFGVVTDCPIVIYHNLTGTAS